MKVLKIVLKSTGGAKHKSYYNVSPDATEAKVDAVRHAMKHNHLLKFPNWSIAFILPT